MEIPPRRCRILPSLMGFVTLDRRHGASVLRKDAMIIPASRGIARLRHLDAFLEERGDVAVGWGMKPSGLRARTIAKRLNIPFRLVEDGFLRSVERDGPPLSLIIDDEGVYYDASGASRIERLIATPVDEQQRERARALIAAWQNAGVSKYNHAPEYQGELPDRYVLAVDQTMGDEAIAGGQAEQESFDRLLEAALAARPDCMIVAKVHPDIFSHGKKGYFDLRKLGNHPRIRIIAESCHAVRLIRQAQAIFTVTSQMGFEGLIWGKPVHCFGMPFYAGWGLTRDVLAVPHRRFPIPLEQLVHGALIEGPRYVDPKTGRRCEVEDALALVVHERRALENQWLAKGYSPYRPSLIKTIKNYFTQRRPA